MAHATEHALPHTPAAPRLARSLAHEAFDPQLDEGRRHDLGLLVSEIVCNAVRHAPARPDRTISLRLEREAGVLRVVVIDGGDWSGSEGPTPRGRFDEEHLGLRIVDQLADRWGTSIHGAAAVWFELHANRRPSSTTRS